jgi:hypothetical protein
VYRVLYFGEKFNKKNSKKLINLKILCTWKNSLIFRTELKVENEMENR